MFVHPSVCPSVCHTPVLCLNGYTYPQSFFSSSGSPNRLVFPHQTGWQYFYGDPPNGGVECKGYETRSSAVAKKPRDASCLSVVSFVASIVQYLKRIFIISYFSFGFTSAYNSILFCCLRRNVKPCCHTYDLSWLCIVRERAWSLSRWRTTETVTLSRVALGGRIPAVGLNDQRYNCHNLQDGGRRPPATMFTTPRLLQRQQQAYRFRIAISAYPTCIRRPR